MRILVACEYSGIVRDAFREAGHDAMSADLRPTERPGPHYRGDARDVIGEGWDLLIAHPPCTYLANSGVWLLHRRHGREAVMRRACRLFRAFLDAPVPRICVENPVPHGYARNIVGNYTQTIQPWQFGHDASKRTCLWLRNLPELKPTEVIDREVYANQTPSGQNKLSPGPDRAKERARTYPGIARAMADQWTGQQQLLKLKGDQS